ncbi:MAG: asparagine synthase-related protein [Candidatus Omnitrophota bacterium]
MKEIILKLKNSICEAVPERGELGLLFSGGLDSSVLAAINPKMKAINVSLKTYGEDISYASYLAEFLNLDYFRKEVEIEEAIEIIPEVIKLLKSFDPAIPNDMVVYFGLKKAKEMGIKEILAGDGSDELFAGYSFMRKMDDLEEYIKRISSLMTFSSNDLAAHFNMHINQPFLNEYVIDLAVKMPREFKIKNENEQTWGKWILRKAFEDMLPKRTCWQTKRPLECGSGMDKIREVITSKVSDAEWKEEAQKLPIKFINKEHFYYYKVYQRVIGEIPKPGTEEKECPGCGAGMKVDAFHCKICGCVLDWRETK